MKKVLIISSEYTGHGHKSVHTALLQGFKSLYKEEIECKVINGFTLGGPDLIAAERLYNTCIKYFPKIWNNIFRFSFKNKNFINKHNSRTIKRRFIKIIKNYNPDIIVNVHPMFSGSLLNVIKKKNINIKFFIIITDLITITKLWFDNRADKIISPSNEASEYMIKNGIDRDRIITFGLPVREGFDALLKSKEEIIEKTNIYDTLKILLLNNSEKTKRLIHIINGLYSRYKCEVTVVCGRSKKTYGKLQEFFSSRSYSPNIIGYTNELPKLFHQNDILITRSGPTAIIEAVNCLIPVVSMGALPGQEEENPIYLNRNGLGYNTSSTDDIFNKIDLLIANNRENLIKVRENQFDYYGRDVREKIVKYIAGSIENK
ncbi:glycosyltransferase [uncultured Brachyspira sp.]|uniref:MGDG synthase family glycosyltransferase n=1 Tax=uncultured Brachyspira sp. TaxID=221953 RepID=UPI0025F798BA|nr:glycosyltransferase [uncultured Brachyspira sp.]